MYLRLQSEKYTKISKQETDWNMGGQTYLRYRQSWMQTDNNRSKEQLTEEWERCDWEDSDDRDEEEKTGAFDTNSK